MVTKHFLRTINVVAWIVKVAAKQLFVSALAVGCVISDRYVEWLQQVQPVSAGNARICAASRPGLFMMHTAFLPPLHPHTPTVVCWLWMTCAAFGRSSIAHALFTTLIHVPRKMTDVIRDQQTLRIAFAVQDLKFFCEGHNVVPDVAC